MANLKEVRGRILSVISTQQITKAMKMVSAAKLRRAQDRIVQMRPYANKLKDILENLTTSMEGEISSPFAEVRPVEKVLLIAVTSNRGLCGGFNSNIIKATTKRILNEYAEHQKAGNLFIKCIGKKGQEYFTKHGFQVVGNHNELFNDISFDATAEIANEVMNNFAEATYDRVEVLYNEFKNPVVQIVQNLQILPVEKQESEVVEEKATNRVDYILEPEKEDIIREVIPKSIKIQLYKAVLDSNASEHGARMTAMDSATENANELLKDLRISYNRARQAAITTELTEIVAGANALGG